MLVCSCLLADSYLSSGIRIVCDPCRSYHCIIRCPDSRKHIQAVHVQTHAERAHRSWTRHRDGYARR